MSFPRRSRAVVPTVVVAGVVTALVMAASPPPASAKATRHHSRHVLLLSVDGLHQSDLARYVGQHRHSALASLVRRGIEFTNARTPFPSDSFPGLVGQLTGGQPRTTGVYYDVSYNHFLIDPTASSDARPPQTVCRATARGANVVFDESLDRDGSRLDAGQGLSGLPGSILAMTGRPQSLIDTAALPIDPRTCARVYPHSYLKVNTVFEVAKAHGLRTAWSDKHPAYEILNGPSGTGLDDLFAPEINSKADNAGNDWTTVNSLTRKYDHFKVQSVLNEIRGYDHSGTRAVGVPAIFGMNFQSVSTAEKLPVSDGKAGGYNADGSDPGPLLQNALAFVDRELGSIDQALKDAGEQDSTTVIVSAKHGQSPQDSRSLKRINDGTVIDGLNAAWASAHPTAAQPLVAASLNDDGMLLWFTGGDRTRQADAFASRFLRSYNGIGDGSDGHARATDIGAAPVRYTASGLAKVYAGPDAASFIGVEPTDGRVPDLIGAVQHGVVYTGKTKKIAEHGGDDPQDRNVPLLISDRSVKHRIRADQVQTTQIAPTILDLLGLDPQALKAVAVEGTRGLPLR